jgi:NADPH:quinone reductase-like Zn-dependent oxidoreductase/acyl carrier protein
MENYFSHSPLLQPFADAVRSVAENVLRAGQPGLTVNILQIAKNTDAFLPGMLPLLDARTCRYVVAEKDASVVEALALQYESSPAVSFTLLNPEDPAPEHKGRYHLILLAWSLHEHLNSARALEGCRSLLVPGGVLCLLEHAPSVFTDYVFGARPSWWAASASGTLPVSLLRDMAHWKISLEQAGFTDIQTTGNDEENFCPAFLLLAEKPKKEIPAEVPAEEILSKEELAADPGRQAISWLIVTGDKGAQGESLGNALLAELTARGERAVLLSAGAALADGPFRPENGDSWRAVLADTIKKPRKERLHVVYLAGYDVRQELSLAELAELQNFGTTGLAGLIGAWDTLRPAMRLFVLSGGALADGMSDARPVPSQGAVVGFARVLMNEIRVLETRILDLHGDLAAALESVPLVVRELLKPDGEPEIALCRGLRFAPRMTALPPGGDNDNDNDNGHGEKAAALTFDAPGRLRNLYWKAMPLPVPQADEVRIEVKYTGLNFRDVMWCMGMLLDEALENGFSGPGMGIECSGIVSAVGSEVKNWKPGDPVVAFTPSGFSSHVITKASAVTGKPANISFAEAATIPVAFFTAWYSLKHLARLQPGERVLIHGAAGGVGLAAIQIATLLGLEIHATAGSSEKHSFLRQLGVRHIFSSRSLAFARQVLDATGGQGVDAVLNSLAGEAIPAGLSVLRPFGRFLELGKRDFYADTPLRLRPFSNNLSYYGVDVDQLLIHQPALAGNLFSELMQLFAERKLVPLPHTTYPVARTVEAFKTMQQSAHVGKLVVSLDKAVSIAQTPAKSMSRANFSPEATYLVTGGTEGLGLASAARLARRGAKNLLLLSRGGLKDHAAEKIVSDMRDSGVQVVVAKADVANPGKLRQCLHQHLGSMPPLRGIIHAAAVLDDGLITSLTPERIARSLAAKSLGAWNLHTLSLSFRLDFFVLYSSAAAPFGNPGQASYIAANCMLETLGAYRKTLKLPATVIGWGAIADTGMITRNPRAREMLLKILGISPTPSADALYWLEHVIRKGVPGSYYFGLDWQSRADLPALARPRFSRLRPRQAAAFGSEGPDLEHIRSLSPNEGVACISSMLIDEISHVLRLPKDRLTPDTSLVAQGMDSLMAVELALAIEQKFELTGYTLPLSEKTTAASLAESLYTAITGTAGGTSENEQAEQRILRTVEQKHGFHLSDASRDAVVKHMSRNTHEQ